jgi:hypothetical protein
MINDYVQSSSDAPQATLQILEFNVHSVRPMNDPSGSPLQINAGDLPQDNDLIGVAFDDSLGVQLYTPRDLASDRSNLNASWYQVRRAERFPITDYFNISVDNGQVSTVNGWPGELYLLLSRLERLLLTWGSVDPEMEGYDFERDARYVFPSGYLSMPRRVQESSSGSVTSGCFYSEDATTAQRANNTWAVNVINNADDASQSDFVRNMTSCGISPILNTTLGGEDAGSSYLAYQHFAEAAIIGWATDEPKNTSSPNTRVDGPADQFRCAIIVANDDFRGRWRVANCQERFQAACRSSDEPFQWQLTNDAVDFTAAPGSCPEGTSFDTPVTSLENNYLYQHIRSNAANKRSGDVMDGVWLNLNSLDSQDCWVTTGPNGECRYRADADERHNRMVLIPAIGALIILLLTVMTILVKCNVNRRNSRRHRIGPGGWEYEGVPS